MKKDERENLKFVKVNEIKREKSGKMRLIIGLNSI